MLAEFLPADWPRAEARERFLAAYGALGPMAQGRFRELVQGVATHASSLS